MIEDAAKKGLLVGIRKLPPTPTGKPVGPYRRGLALQLPFSEISNPWATMI